MRAARSITAVTKSEVTAPRLSWCTSSPDGEAASMATGSASLSGLEPEACWRHFDALIRIGRPARHGEHVLEHVRGWAAEHGSKLRQDAARNLVVCVPASAGRESAPTIASASRR